MMSRLLELIRKRRAELQAQGLEHPGPITDEDRERVARRLIADAPHDPAAAELLRKTCAIAPEVEAWVKEIAAEMQAGGVLDDVLRGRRLHPSDRCTCERLGHFRRQLFAKGGHHHPARRLLALEALGFASAPESLCGPNSTREEVRQRKILIRFGCYRPRRSCPRCNRPRRGPDGKQPSILGSCRATSR